MITIDGYTDIAPLGRGGVGDVYRATRESTGGIVAIKVSRDVSDQSAAWRRARRELTALVFLAGHRNVIQLIELLELDSGPALIMEYAPGGSVADLMRRRQFTLSVSDSVLIGRQTASALAAAHDRGIVHRDVKPQNLLIDAYGQIKLCDFGIASLTQTDEFRARTSSLSLRYASPEDLNDDVDVGLASDIYSLGATLLHLARGAPPTLKERLAPWIPPNIDDPNAAALDKVIAACLQPDPGDRPPAAAIAERLDRLALSIGTKAQALDITDPIENDLAADATTDPRPTEASIVTETIHRSARRPAASTPPELDFAIVGPASSFSGRSGRQIVASAAAGLAAMVAFVFLLALLFDGFGLFEPSHSAESLRTEPPIDRIEIELVARPTELGPIETQLWPFGDVADCLVQIGGSIELAQTPCTSPHDLQRFVVADLDARQFPAEAEFDAERVDSSIAATCDSALAPWVGSTELPMLLDAPSTRPSAGSWARGDRRFQCFIGVTGHRIIGNAAGSGPGSS